MRGELKTRATPVGETTLAPGERYALSADGSGERVTLAEMRHVGGRLIARLAGVESVEAATPYIGRELFLERDSIVLEKGEYLDEDLVGLRLVDPFGVEVGVVATIEHFPAQDCLVLASRGGLVPLVKAFVRRIDLDEGTILVTLPEGLLEG